MCGEWEGLEGPGGGVEKSRPGECGRTEGIGIIGKGNERSGPNLSFGEGIEGSRWKWKDRGGN